MCQFHIVLKTNTIECIIVMLEPPVIGTILHSPPMMKVFEFKSTDKTSIRIEIGIEYISISITYPDVTRRRR